MIKPARKKYLSNKLTEFRHALSYIDALPQLTLLGFVVGIITGLIIIAFRLLIDLPLHQLLPGHSDNFEALTPQARGVLIFSGISALALLMHFIAPRNRDMSVSHVLDRMHNHQSKLPLKNWVLQFIGGVVCMVSGQSVGREGPVVHLGAGAASFLAQWMKLPNNSMQTLVACGVAAAISASFDTPMAGVVFAMEVLALEYTLVGLSPIILASVMGTMVSKAVLGGAALVVIGDTSMVSLFEIPLMIVVGIAISLCASVYIRLNIFTLKFSRVPISLRIFIAGVIMATVALAVPQIMGQGFDTVNAALLGQISLSMLVLIALAKLCVTPSIIGLGLPGGLIGPLLVIGACAGGAMGLVIAHTFPWLNVQPGFYVMMGMIGMMAASLNAPLTALVTVLELTYNPNTIFPAMLVVVVACLSTRQAFKLKGIFVEQLEHTGRALDFAPTKQSLLRAGVRSVMDTRFAICNFRLPFAQAHALLEKQPAWLILCNEEGRYEKAMRAADLAHYLADNTIADSAQTRASDDDDTASAKISTQAADSIDLNEIPGRRYLIGALHESASLYEAMQVFIQEDGSEVIYISGSVQKNSSDIQGVLTRTDIENYYRPPEFKHVMG